MPEAQETSEQDGASDKLKPLQISITRRGEYLFHVVIQNEREITKSFAVAGSDLLGTLKREAEELQIIPDPLNIG